MVAVIWIDWYAYHLARLRALTEHYRLGPAAVGVELVGGCGVHGRLRFRADSRGNLPIETLLPDRDWAEAGQWELAAHVWKKLNRMRPSVILIPGYYTLPALAAALWGRLHRSRNVLMTETTAEDHPRHAVKELIKRLIIQSLFDWAVVGGTRHSSYLQQLGFREDRIARCYDVVDNGFYATGVERLRAAHARPENLPAQYLLFVGRLAPEKNVSGLLRACAEFWRHSDPNAPDLVLAGDGPLRQELEREAAQLGVSARVHFAGLRSAEQMLEYYAFAKAFVLPSVREPWGLVVNEAMAAGLPVLVSSRCGCADDLVHDGENGFTFDPDRPQELTNLLLTISMMGESELANMGRRSAEIIQAYSPAVWASEVARIVGS